MLVWLVYHRKDEGSTAPKRLVLCQGRDREEAKRNARPELLGNPDNYIVSPLTRVSDQLVVKLDIRHGEEYEGSDYFSRPVGG